MYGRPDAPSKDTILAARDRVLVRYPKLRVVGAHLGSNEEHLDQLAKRLDAMPNFAVDVASRVRYLGIGSRETVREFVLRYQDRLMYATDFVLADDEEAGAANLVSRHDAEWNFFADPKGGLALPDPVLRKIFRENAVRWFPGII
jgi:predicted TIM-barrel fold metal-dependent hydrolase